MSDLKDREGIERALVVQQTSLAKWEANPATAPNILNMIYVCATIEDGYDAIVEELGKTTDDEQRVFLERARDWNLEAAGRIQKLAKTLGYQSIAENPPLADELATRTATTTVH